MSNYVQYAMTEFKAAGWLNDDDTFKDDMQKDVCEHILKLLEVFHDEGHSGSSAPYAVRLFSKLAMFTPIVPLTGEDWEWNETSRAPNSVTVYQNKRCSAVFKQADRFDGQPYYLDGKIFWEWFRGSDGTMRKSHFTNSESFVPIEFPYTPKSEYVFRPTEEFPNEFGEFVRLD